VVGVWGSWRVRTNACKSFSYYLFADPHPINPVVSYFYKIMGGEGVPTRAPTSNLEPLTSEFFPQAGSGPPTVVPAGIGGVLGAEGTFGAITGWSRL
jgi:hypothetical protein